MSTDHVDASHAERIDIPDAELLFRGHFARSGPDLVLTGQDGHRLVVTGYFSTEKHSDLVAPNGAHLTGDLVDLLAGSPTPGHYAQAKTTLPPEAIGKVEKVVGHVTLIHNGVAGPLHVGDPVYKTDIVETAANSSCGIAFPDGTALDLVNNTRMALNEYNYEANSASNGAIFSLVEGTFAFVAGQVAHTGEGMKINTPVATMGIRGTVGLFRTEPTVINSNLGHVWSVFLHEDIDGSHHLGRIAFIDQDPTSPTFGQVFYLLDSSEYIAYLEPQGPGSAPHVRLEPITNSRVFDDRHFYDDLGQIISAYQAGTVNPESVPGTPGSGDNPSLLFNPLDLFLEDGGKPLFDFAPSLTPGSSTPPQLIFGGFPVLGGLLPNTNTPNGPTSLSTVFIWNGTGAWPTAIANWNQGSAPNSPADSVIIQSGTVTFNLPSTTISSLTVDPGATLDIVGGQLNTGGLTDNGKIIVDGDPPKLVINGPATIGSGGLMQVVAAGSEVDFNHSTLDNHGVVAVQQQGIVVFNGELVTNEPGAVIAAVGGFIIIENTILDNLGIIGAGSDGNITIANSVINNSGGIIGTADVGGGYFGGSIDLSNATIVGGMVIAAGDAIDVVAAPGANMSVFDGSTSALTVAGLVAVLPGAQLELKGAIHLDDGGEISLGGWIPVGDSAPPPTALVINGNVTLETDGEPNASIALYGAHIIGAGPAANFENVNAIIVGYGEIGGGGGSLKFINDASGIVNANVANAALVLEPALTVSNAGILEASNGGILDVRAGVSNSGSIQAGVDSTVLLSGTVDNSGSGIIAAGTGINAAPSAGDGGDNAVFAATNALIASLEELPPPPDGSSAGSSDFASVTLTVGIGELDSFVNLDNATIIGGTLETGGTDVYAVVVIGGGPIPSSYKEFLSFISSGVIQTVTNPDGSASTSVLDGVTNEGFVLVNVNTTLELRHTIANDGEIVVGAGSGQANLVVDGTVTLTGNGTGVIWLSSPTAASLSGSPGADNVLENVNNLIIGSGHIGGNLTLINDAKGFIVADDTSPLIIDTGDNTITNTGTFLATNGGELSVRSAVNDAGGTVEALSGGFVDFFLGISGGTAIINGGKLEYGWSSDVATTFDGSGTLVLDHQDRFDSNFATASFTGTITGFGAHDGIVLSDLAFAPNETAVWNQAAGVLSIYEGATLEATLHFAGNYIGSNFKLESLGGETEVVYQASPIDEWINTQGGSWSVAANWSNGVPTSTTEAALDLTGSMGFTGAYTVTIAPSDNAKAESLTISDTGATLTGSGTLSVELLENHGTIETTGENTLVVNIQNAGTNFGTIKADGGVISFGPVTLTNEPGDGPGGQVVATNWGTIAFNGGTVENGQDGDGTGAVFLAKDHGIITFEGTESNALGITNDSDAGFEAKGCGSLIKFEGPNVEVTNDGGTFLAKDGGEIIFKDIFDLENHDGGKIKAKDGGTVAIYSSYVDNTDSLIAAIGCAAAIVLAGTTVVGGAVEAHHYGVVDLDHATIIGSTLGTDCGGVVQTVCGNSTFQDVTIAGGSDVLVNYGTSLTLVGDIHDWGAIVVGLPQSEGDPDLVIQGNVTLDGTGSVVLNGGNDYIVAGGEGGTLTNDSNIGGAGQIGNGGGLWLDNAKDGTIDADMRGGRLVLDTGWHGVTNAGLLESTGGILEIRSDVDNQGGVIGAYGPDGLVRLFGVTIAGGTLATDCGGTIEVVAMRGDDTNMSVFDGSNGHAVTVDGYVLVDPGANLELIGTIHNKGMIEVDGQQTDLVIDGHVTLDGHGTIMLDNANHPADQIVGGDGDGNTLDNVNNTIDGAGNIGTGNGDLWLFNESCGRIDANACEQTLTLDTGHNQITNAGTLAASFGGTLDVESSVNNAGGSINVSDGGFADFEKSITGGTATIHGGALEFDDASSVAVTFDNSGGHYGELVLGDVKDFSGTIFGFDGRDSEHPSLATTDEIDLVGIAASNVSFGHDGDDAIIRITKDGHIIATITLDDFNYRELEKTSDGHGGTIIFDPPASASTSPSVSIGGAGNDTFVFHPGEGAQMVNNFNPQNETIELDHFANIGNMQELAAAITTDTHGDAVLELGHGDSVTIPGVSASFLQQHLQGLVHLH